MYERPFSRSFQGFEFGYFGKWLNVSARCLVLWFRQFVQRSALQVQDVWLREGFVIEGSRIQLVWSVRGCHKIVIDGVGQFPGDKTGVEFTVRDISTPIDIWFFGRGAFEHRQVDIKGARFTLIRLDKPTYHDVRRPRLSIELTKISLTQGTIAPKMRSHCPITHFSTIAMRHQPFHEVASASYNEEQINEK